MLLKYIHIIKLYIYIERDIYNAKIENIEDKIPDITNLATKTALNAVEHKKPSVSNLVKKINSKVNKIGKKVTDRGHDKYLTTLELFVEYSWKYSTLIFVEI